MLVPASSPLLLLLLFSALCLVMALAGTTAASDQDDTVPSKLSIIHVNDVHSHIDQFSKFGTDCPSGALAAEAIGGTKRPPRSDCGGGYARIKAVVDALRAEYPDNLLLNAGDEFQGTMFYTYYKGEKTAEVVNLMGFDAATIGNHEFDDGPEHLADYLRNLTVPVVCANVNTSIEALGSQLVPYTIVDRYRVGIIGVVTPETSQVSSPGDEVHFVEPLDLMQGLIDELHAQGIRRIIALTHIGYGADIELVRQTRGLSLVVGGHSHTFLGDVPWSEGPYPTVAQDLDGVDVPIVTNGKWGFNLGHLQVEFDRDGRVVAHAGQPIQLLGGTVEPDRKLDAQIAAWKTPFLKFASEVVGYARGSFAQMTCQITECSVGNLVADAMLAAHPRADLALVNAGGLRAGLPRGNVTRGQVLTVLPFGSTLVDLTFTGRALWDVMEGIVSWQNLETGHEITSFAQISGLRIRYSSARPVGSRLSAMQIRHRHTTATAATTAAAASTPRNDGTEGDDDDDDDDATVEFREIDMDRNYTVCTLDFTVAGGDFWWPERRGYDTQTEKVDDALVTHLTHHPRVSPRLDGRIRDDSLRGRVRAHAEAGLAVLERTFTFWLACFGAASFESGGGKVLTWIGMRAIASFCHAPTVA